MYESLQHHGVKGQKWGVRRTPQQLGYETTSGDRRQLSDKELKYLKKGVDNVGTQVNNTKTKRYSKNKKANDERIREDLSKMSDKELKDMVNRLNMEERYVQVMSSRYTETGKSRTDRLLDNIGTAITVTSSALSIAIAIKELSK